MVPAAILPRHDVAASQRTILELIGHVLESAFEVVGEGVLLGTLPPYLERFGARNAEYVRRHHVRCDPASGAVAALTPMNFVSRTLGSPFTMEEARKDRAVKRLTTCEFAPAFAGRSDFAKAMMCQIHRASYQGSVDGLLADPKRDGYDVTLHSRILFGASACDFEVSSRASRPDTPDHEGEVVRPVAPDEVARDVHTFYTAILVSLVQYLGSVLPHATVQAILHAAALEVGAKLARIDPQPGASAQETVERLLAIGGRDVLPMAGGAEVRGCPYAHTIQAMAKGASEAAAQARASACLLCVGTLRGALQAAGHGTDVELASCLTSGDAACRFRLEASP
ncbi:MAG TPA: hypothetical protein VFH47_08705 [Candidatus Thermoplasmatota archaeon]|nr:hypothetical protein [Candidatus Thermoplasmatota archaeon]